MFYVFLTDSSDASLIFMTLLINDLPAVPPISLFNVTKNNNNIINSSSSDSSSSSDNYHVPSNQWVKVILSFLLFCLFLLIVCRYSILSRMWHY